MARNSRNLKEIRPIGFEIIVTLAMGWGVGVTDKCTMASADTVKLFKGKGIRGIVKAVSS